MGVIVIKADNESNRILLELAKKLGAEAVALNDDQAEDMLLGYAMDMEKTGELMDPAEVMQKLNPK
jgi:K+-sensing histidine kinase KdpD